MLSVGLCIVLNNEFIVVIIFNSFMNGFSTRSIIKVVEFCRCSFYLHPFEGSAVQILTQGKLSAPRILRIHKVSLFMQFKEEFFCMVFI